MAKGKSSASTIQVLSEPTPTLYVSPSGNDNASGSSPVNALKTLQRAADIVANAGGAVREIAIENGEQFEGFRLASVGAPGSDRLKIGGYGPARALPLIKGTITLLTSTSPVDIDRIAFAPTAGGAIDIAGTIPGLRVDRCASTGGTGLLVDRRHRRQAIASDIVVNDCDVSASEWGVDVSSDGLVVTNTRFRNVLVAISNKRWRSTVARCEFDQCGTVLESGGFFSGNIVRNAVTGVVCERTPVRIAQNLFQDCIKSTLLWDVEGSAVDRNVFVGGAGRDDDAAVTIVADEHCRGVIVSRNWFSDLARWAVLLDVESDETSRHSGHSIVDNSIGATGELRAISTCTRDPAAIRVLGNGYDCPTWGPWFELAGNALYLPEWEKRMPESGIRRISAALLRQTVQAAIDDPAKFFGLTANAGRVAGPDQTST